MPHPFRSLANADEVFPATMPDGAVLPVYRLAGPPRAPALLFGHANGFAAGSYAPWLALLAEHFRVYAFDARGHGGAHWPDGPLDEVFANARMAEDLLHLTDAVVAHHGGSDLIYVGHSLGGATALYLLAQGAKPRWRTTVIVEPPIFPPPGSPSYAQANTIQPRHVAGALRRRADWASPEALFARLQRSPMFSRFTAAMLMAHCRATLRPKPGGGYTLACPPAVESTIFRCHRDAETWTRLARISLPVELIGGDPATPDNDWISGALPEIAARLPRAHLTMVPQTAHMPMCEKPDLCAGLVLERVGAASSHAPEAL